MAGQNFVIYRKTPPGDRAVPDFMIATARTFKVAAVGAKNFFEPRRVARHSGSQSCHAAFFMLVTDEEFYRTAAACDYPIQFEKLRN